MAERIEQMTIVGGGTAGWMSAILLESVLRRPPGEAPLRICLIESPNVATVGVGEATVPGMPRTLKTAGVKEADFIRHCNASFKLGVDFVNWNVDEAGRPISFINPFSGNESLKGRSPGYYFHRFGREPGPGHMSDFTAVVGPSPEMVAARKGPRAIGAKDYESDVNYAYHMDAGLFADFLSNLAVERGIEHIRDDVTEVELAEDGSVAALQLKEGGRHPVELVIDCTGFRGLVIRQALGEPFEPYDDYLLNDRALAVQIPHQDPTKLEPVTRSTALGAGWVWRVPLQSRIGTGYVFSSKFRSDEEATEEFLAHLGLSAAEAQPRVIPIGLGKLRRSWVKNCIAIGLSGGFIEPLESTAIYMIDMGIRWLYSYFPDRGFDPALSRRYNALVDSLYSEVRDFIVLHYHLNNRSDSPYWVTAREEMRVPDSLAENLAVWRHTLPNRADLATTHLFDAMNYSIGLFGKRFYGPEVDFPKAQGIQREDWQSYLMRLGQAKQALLAHLPDHYELIRSIRGEERPAVLPEAAPFAEYAGYRSSVPLPGTQFRPEIRLPPKPAGDASGNLL